MSLHPLQVCALWYYGTIEYACQPRPDQRLICLKDILDFVIQLHHDWSEA